MTARAQLVEAALKAGHRVQIRAAGTSMRPLLPSGVRLTVEPLERDQLQSSDIVVALCEGQLVAHRLVSRTPLILRGDSAPQFEHDPEVLGRVVAVEWHGFTYRIDQGWGRLWSLACAHLGPWIRRAETISISP